MIIHTSIKLRLFIISIILSASGCVAPNFHPTTTEGAMCKQQCAQTMQLCSGSSYTCDRSYAKCIESCIDIENVVKLQNK